MKTAVVYTSQTGFTKRYAEWIAQAAGADCFGLSAAKKEDLSAYGAIVFGGWARAGGISKIGWFKGHMGQWAGKKLAVFCVGASPMDSPEIGAALQRVFTGAEQDKVRIFYCPGGFNYEKMPAPSRLMMKLFIGMLKARKNRTDADRAMVNIISSSYDISDKRYIEPILQYLEE